MFYIFHGRSPNICTRPLETRYPATATTTSISCLSEREERPPGESDRISTNGGELRAEGHEMCEMCGIVGGGAEGVNRGRSMMTRIYFQVPTVRG